MSNPHLANYEVKLLDRALMDLDNIYSYIANSLQMPEASQSLVNELEQHILSLRQLPQRCPQRTIGAYARKGYRQLFVKNFTVIFRIDEPNKQVIIVTVRYSKSSF